MGDTDVEAAAFMRQAFGTTSDSEGDDEEPLAIGEPSASATTTSTAQRTRPRYVPDPRNGFVGLLNQGATCYLNSLIQGLFFTPEVRRGLYELTDEELGTPHLEEANALMEKISNKSVIIIDDDLNSLAEMGFSKNRARRALAKADGDVLRAAEMLANDEIPSVRRVPITLRQFFAKLQGGDQKSLSTKEITSSFGWENNEVYQQHDVQELHRILLDALERSLKDTSQPNLVNDVFQGRMVNRVYCIKCGYTSQREEDWLDILVDVKGIKSLSDSLQQMVQPEYLIRDNKYFCEKCNGKSDAKRSSAVRSLPPVLNVSLKRFDYDLLTLRRKKVMDRFVFPLVLDMGPFMEANLTENVSRTAEDDRLLQDAEQEAIRDEAIRAKQKEAQSRRNGGQSGSHQRRNTPAGGLRSVPETIAEGKDEEDGEGGYAADQSELHAVDEKVDLSGAGGEAGAPDNRESAPPPSDVISSQNPRGDESADISHVGQIAAGENAIEMGAAPAAVGDIENQADLFVQGHAIGGSDEREGSVDSMQPMSYQEESIMEDEGDRAPFPAQNAPYATQHVSFGGANDFFPSTFDEEEQMFQRALAASLAEAGVSVTDVTNVTNDAYGRDYNVPGPPIHETQPLLNPRIDIDQFDPLSEKKNKDAKASLLPGQLVKLVPHKIVANHPGDRSPNELSYDEAKMLLDGGQGQRFFGFWDVRCASWRLGQLERAQDTSNNLVIRLQPCDEMVEYPSGGTVKDSKGNKVNLSWLNMSEFPTKFISDHVNFTGPQYKENASAEEDVEQAAVPNVGEFPTYTVEEADDERAQDEDDEADGEAGSDEPNPHADRTLFVVGENVGYKFPTSGYVTTVNIARLHSTGKKVFVMFQDEWTKSQVPDGKKYMWMDVPNPNFCAVPPPGASAPPEYHASPTRAITLAPNAGRQHTSPGFNRSGGQHFNSGSNHNWSSASSSFYKLEKSEYDANSEHLYVLHAVVIHSGTPYGGHYHVYVKDIMDEGPEKIGGREDTKEEDEEKTELKIGKHVWYDFNDSYVSRVVENYLARQYGGSSESAYMLIYRRYDGDSPVPRVDMTDSMKKYIDEYNEQIQRDRIEAETERNRVTIRIIKPRLFVSMPGQLNAEPFAYELLQYIRAAAVAKENRLNGKSSSNTQRDNEGDVIMSDNPLSHNVTPGALGVHESAPSLSNLSTDGMPALEPDEDDGRVESLDVELGAVDMVDVWNENDEYLQKSTVKGLYSNDLERCASEFIAMHSYSITVDGRNPLSELVDAIKELFMDEECDMDIPLDMLQLHEFRFGRSVFGSLQNIRELRNVNVGINIQPENLFDKWTARAEYDCKEMEKDVKEPEDEGENSRQFSPRTIQSIFKPQLLFAWDGRQLNGDPFDLKSARTGVFRVRYYYKKEMAPPEVEPEVEAHYVPPPADTEFEDVGDDDDFLRPRSEDVRPLDASEDEMDLEVEYQHMDVSVPVSCSMKEMWEHIRRAFELESEFVPMFTLTSDRPHEECKKFDWRDVMADSDEKFSWTERPDFVADLSRGRVNTRPFPRGSGREEENRGMNGHDGESVGSYPPRSRKRQGTPTAGDVGGFVGMNLAGVNHNVKDMLGIDSGFGGFSFTPSDFSSAPTINFENAHELGHNVVSKAEADWKNRTQNITILIEDNTVDTFTTKMEKLRRPKGIRGDDLFPAIRKALNVPAKLDVVFWKRERTMPRSIVRPMQSIHTDCSITVELGRFPTQSTECYIFVCLCIDDAPTNCRPLLVVRHDPVPVIKRQILDRFHMQTEHEKDYVLYKMHNGTKHTPVKENSAIWQAAYIYDGSEMWLEKGPFPQDTKTIHVAVVSDTRNLEVPWSDTTSVASNYEYGTSVYVSQHIGMSTVNQKCTYDELRKHITRMNDLKHVPFNRLRVNYFNHTLCIPLSVPVLHSDCNLKNQKKWSSPTRGTDICVEVLPEDKPPLDHVSKFARFVNSVLVRRLVQEVKKDEEDSSSAPQAESKDPDAAVETEAETTTAQGLEYWPNDAPVRLFFDPEQQCITWTMFKTFFAEKYNLNADLIVGGVYKVIKGEWVAFNDSKDSGDGLGGAPWHVKPGGTDMAVIGIMECGSEEEAAKESELIADWNPPPVSEKAKDYNRRANHNVGFYGALDGFDSFYPRGPEAQLKIDVD